MGKRSKHQIECISSDCLEQCVNDRSFHRQLWASPQHYSQVNVEDCPSTHRQLVSRAHHQPYRISIRQLVCVQVTRDDKGVSDVLTISSLFCFRLSVRFSFCCAVIKLGRIEYRCREMFVVRDRSYYTRV